MSPKYKGKDEDWLDDEVSKGSRNQSKSKKKSKPLVGFIDPKLTTAQVVEIYPHQCMVLNDEGQRIKCTYRKAKLPSLNERSPVCVGDRVSVERVSTSDGVIDGVGMRVNELSRPAPETDKKHVIASNIDVLVIVTACKNPDFSPGLVDRFMIAAQRQKIAVVICINKMDLWDSSQTLKPWQLYKDLGIEVIETHQEDSELAAKFSSLKNKTTVFAGHSGVGKTSLLNSLTSDIRRVGDVNSITGKGQHTTTGSMMLEGTRWIDTPGVRAFGLFDFHSSELRDYFSDLSEKCELSNCQHQEEPSCQAKSKARFESYQRIYDSLKEDEEYA